MYLAVEIVVVLTTTRGKFTTLSAWFGHLLATHHLAGRPLGHWVPSGTLWGTSWFYPVEWLVWGSLSDPSVLKIPALN